nr:PREDICTED: trehalase-like [Bemisia tabaci]
MILSGQTCTKFLAKLSFFLVIGVGANNDYNKVSNGLDRPPPPCNMPLWCNSDLFKQMSLYEHDTYAYMHKKLLHPQAEILRDYDVEVEKNEGNPLSRSQLQTFIDKNMEDTRSEIVEFLPSEYKEETDLMGRVKSPEYREFLRALQKIWKLLLRKVSLDVKEHEDRYSLIYIEEGFIVAGGHFRELYYWDTYWVINGLLLSDMPETAKGIIENFLALIKRFKFIPNGTRVYYLNRSQPPLLPRMVNSYVQATKNYDFIRANLQVITDEFEWWLQNRQVKFVKGGKSYEMFQYKVPATGPRPECYWNDYSVGDSIQSEDERDRFYSNIKSATESGWDFSSRWFDEDYGRANGSLLDLKPTTVVPVELNAILEENARFLSEWWHLVNDTKMEEKYAQIADELLQSIHEVLWRSDLGCWFDWDLKNEKHREDFYLSNITPLWTQSYSLSKKVVSEKIIQYLKRSGILCKNGLPKFIAIPTSLIQSGHQWDYPNAWAPLQSFLINGLINLRTAKAEKIALQLAQNWVYTTYVGHKNTTFMFEKYDAVQIGKTGGGGEYAPQTGFGWTNGFVIQLLGTYPEKLSPTASKTC